ncbi:2Fe-2S ferredoxin-type domain-containing protein [Schizophyllum amplum]|uniref:2Fe-2S ferredoxin-type domain-containing protein n=1 Tax=Schizophyllum amplum TaxID=97359 RepID=A0A550BTW0_9AGAR|nr:2Fe-2S ferredoxin-type domain-containing protein [Auriculariopsis ampla]
MHAARRVCSSLASTLRSRRPTGTPLTAPRVTTASQLAPRPQPRPAARFLHTSPVARHGSITRPEPGTGIKVHFKDAKGNDLKTVEAMEGDDILSIAHEHDIDLEGACEGSIACSTCHVILPEEYYDILPEPSDDENDMLDMAFGLTDTSRLGCQVQLSKEMDGMSITLPAATRNMFVDGHKPSH